ncbi:hypothetical protein CAOG_005233 [Capsaspora owczarzaki ATCC 30864]|uniref:Uncharacterized protein n=2 Tax=Capsaspora owczarzaki (strain ATCC 30864) TaxID=595528 RepID=A0A0D2X3N4_CAPO3|nr:hypothetical protein CAOG_005233 [Capsaspora owczarzaki ATCC 30864]
MTTTTMTATTTPTLLLAAVAMVMAAAVIGTTSAFDPPTYNSTVYEAFFAKVLLNPLPPLTSDPYNDPTINTTLPDFVCAAKYPDPTNRTNYVLQTYTDPTAASNDGAYVTHLHPCGYCSSAQDMAVYMQDPNLTDPVRKCCALTYISQEESLKCLIKIGFTENCARIWMYNGINTRKHCSDLCLAAWIEGTPSNVPPNSTTLNPCLQCDEDQSGPVFKLIAGRTRRDSGLLSSINRPPDTIYAVYQYWY